MNIYEYYVEKNKDSKWRTLYQSTAAENFGKTFLYINTNYRSLYAFVDTFEKFLAYNNVDRSQWPLHAQHGQEKAKQWVVNMTQSKLFRKTGNMYSLTAKGIAFKDMIDQEFSEDAQWLLIHLFMSNSYFGLVPNYITKTCNKVLSALIEAGYTYEEIIEKIKHVLSRKSISITELFATEIFWMLTFYREKDFLYIFKNSNTAEKDTLYNYCINNYQNHTYSDSISYKFKPSGQYAKNTFIDDLKTIYFTTLVSKDKPQSITEFLNSNVNHYTEIYMLGKEEKEKLEEFVSKHADVFQVVYKEVFGDIEEDLVNDYEYTPRDTKNVKEEKVDDTTAKNEEQIKRMSSVLKRMAKEKAGYKCELHDLNNCRYFTSKESKQNYLEIHHLVPREFSNEFEHSIEILDNYIAMCPHCHRLLHFATDRERISSLNYLFNKRHSNLESKKIVVSIKELKLFYGIEE